jgi:hypothetical protein
MITKGYSRSKVLTRYAREASYLEVGHPAQAQTIMGRICGSGYGRWNAQIKSSISSGELLIIVIHSGLTWKPEDWTLIIAVSYAMRKVKMVML